MRFLKKRKRNVRDCNFLRWGKKHCNSILRRHVYDPTTVWAHITDKKDKKDSERERERESEEEREWLESVPNFMFL